MSDSLKVEDLYVSWISDIFSVFLMGCFASKKTGKSVPKSKFNGETSEHFNINSETEYYVHSENIQKHYKLKEVLGQGFFGNVRLATTYDENSKYQYAVKTIPKTKVAGKTQVLLRELEILKRVDHPNIIKLYEIYEDELYIHLVMELCFSGELFDHLIAKGRFSESETADIIYKLLHAISHLNNLNISHRDIKPENIMYCNTNQSPEIKLIDFGLASKYGVDEDSMHSIVGSPYYVAPEVLRKNYGPECDVWSIGVLMYLLLVGKPPFNGNSNKEIFVRILEGNYSLQGKDWENISSEAKDLLAKLLTVDQEARVTPHSAMEHPWFTLNCHSPPTRRTERVLRRLKRFRAGNDLRREVMNILVRHLNTEEIVQLNNIFRNLDNTGSGYISADKLQEGLEKIGHPMSSEAVEELVSKVQHNPEGNIKYSEFIAATIDKKNLLDKENRWITFKFFDQEDKGYITSEDLKHALETLGIEKSNEEIEAMVQEAGLKYDRWIEYSEFCKILDPYPDDVSSYPGSVAVSNQPSFNEEKLRMINVIT